MRFPEPIRTQIAVIVGVGLLGGSLALAFRKRGLFPHIVGVGRNPQRLQMAVQQKLIDEACTSVERAARQADWIFVCTPVDQIASHVARMIPYAQPGTIVTDVGSVKGPICHALARYARGDVVFVGSHPIAGSEKQGFENSYADLFDGKPCVITPLPAHDATAVDAVESLWRRLGMSVTRASPEEHDEILATTSHLPHFLASILASLVPPQWYPFTGTGFRDTTRVACGDAQLWTAIFMQNREQLLNVLQRCEHMQSEFKQTLINADAERLCQLLDQARQARTQLSTG